MFRTLPRISPYKNWILFGIAALIVANVFLIIGILILLLSKNNIPPSTSDLYRLNSIMESINKTLTANTAKVEILKNKLQNAQMVLESSNLGKYYWVTHSKV